MAALCLEALLLTAFTVAALTGSAQLTTIPALFGLAAMLGSLVGIFAGGVAFKTMGLVCPLFSVAIVLVLALIEARSFRIDKISA